MIIPSEQYDQILKTMPIPCVDLLVVDNAGYILLVKRQNEPAKGQWWFPGGRVYYKEKRKDAAIRKLKEECNLDAINIQELGTYDLILDNNITNSMVHGITTLFFMDVHNREPFKVDDQSIDADWRTLDEWYNENLNPFVRAHILLTIK